MRNPKSSQRKQLKTFSNNGAGSMPRLRSKILCGHQKELRGIPRQIIRLFVNSFMLRRAVCLLLALYFAR